ncbi:M56 family metallopeptidase [Hanstruepera flava]|uniref:M56 family metallopeptidase n=1 Tax=Hanstruepera flava TaxID=2930218 RepID=UPI0020288F01|nr:M56 family metallopeptidase [Hanstruepera flava]
MDYLLKSSAIIALFYLFYRVFLQRETFFQSNRWFLIIGLAIALLLPSIVIPIYIEYTPIASSTPILITEAVSNNTVAEADSFNWIQVLTYLYIMGVSFFLVKLFIELASLHRLIQRNPKKKVGRYSLIEIFDRVAPFSFFKWIVYNPNQFKKTELNYIINHEKIHANEHHTIDVLIAQICCAIFWFNPLVWLYKNELQQNLEFIADKKAQTISDCKTSYQKLLLKTSVPHHPLVLTNNFYNSLIKKRIIMLHKSKSNKLNAWKYALVVPILALFLMSFNTKEVYISKDIETVPVVKKDFIISSASTDNDLELITNYFKNKPVQLLFSEVVRNSENQLKSLSLNTKHDNGKDYTKRITVSKSDTDVITPFKVSFDSSQDDITLNFLEESSQDNISKHKVSFNKNTTVGKIVPTSKKTREETKDNSLGENPLYVIGSKQYKKEDLPSSKISTEGTIEILNKKESKKRFGSDGRDGAIIFNGHASFGKAETTNYLRLSEFIITKDFSEADINLVKAQLEKEGLKTKIRGIKRNSNGEIIAIKIEVSSDHSKASFNLNDDGPINPIQITFDEGGKNITIGSGRQHRTHVYSTRARNARENRVYRTRSRARAVSGSSHRIHACDTDCDHDHDVKFEFRTDAHDGDDEDVIVRGNNTYVIKNSNTNNGKRTVTITNENGEDEVIELKSNNNVYFFESKDGKISSKNAVWLDDKNKKFEYKIRSKGKGKNFFISTDSEGTPYILKDGKEITKKEMDELDPDNIDTINVIKGDDAVSKYGNKAKDGVIIITSKE